MLTTDDDVLGSVQNLCSPVGMPHSQVTRVEYSTCEQLPRSLGIFEIALGTDVPKTDNLPNLLAVLFHVDYRTFGDICLDNPDRQTGDESMSLSCHLLILF